MFQKTFTRPGKQGDLIVSTRRSTPRGWPAACGNFTARANRLSRSIKYGNLS